MKRPRTWPKRKRREREAQRQRELEAARKLADVERARAEEQTLASGRLRQRAVFLSIALILAGVLAGTALFFWQRAIQANHLANSRELAGASVNNLQVDPERSVLLALQALQESNTLEARNALHRAVPELHLLYSVPGEPGGLPDVAYSPDGLSLATMGVLGQIKIWEADTGALLQALEGEPDEFGGSVAFSPDGRLLAGSWTTQVVVWDLRSGEIIARFSGQSVGATTGYNLGVGQIGFSPDGSRLAVANLDGVSKVWDLATQTAVLTLVPGPDELPAKAIAFNHNGSLLATGGDEGTVKVWDAGTGTVAFLAPVRRHHPQRGLRSPWGLPGCLKRGWQCKGLERVHWGAGREPAAPVWDVRYCLPGQQQICHGAPGWHGPGVGSSHRRAHPHPGRSHQHGDRRGGQPGRNADRHQCLR